MITLTKVDAARNMARFYTLDIQPTLFGEFALVREWGRIGGGSQRLSQWFATEEEAQAAHDRALARRRKREYR
jgi:predicted DNA-binding WGR domain protein